MGEPLVYFSDPQLAIEPISAMVVNEPRNEVYLWASLFIFIVTLVVNTAAVIVIGRKEKTGINRLIVLDSFANLLTAMVPMINLMALSQALTTSSSNDIVCIFTFAMLFILGTWNRLVPVVLALYRYLMVSEFRFHVKCCLNLPFFFDTMKDKMQLTFVLRCVTPFLCRTKAERKLFGQR